MCVCVCTYIATCYLIFWQEFFSCGGSITDALLTFFGHPHFQALLQPAVLTAVAGDFVDDAVLFSVARVDHVLLDTSPEETLNTNNTNRTVIQTPRDARMCQSCVKTSRF